jgi:hypothetical protein
MARPNRDAAREWHNPAYGIEAGYNITGYEAIKPAGATHWHRWPDDGTIVYYGADLKPIKKINADNTVSFWWGVRDGVEGWYDAVDITPDDVDRPKIRVPSFDAPAPIMVIAGSLTIADQEGPGILAMEMLPHR